MANRFNFVSPGAAMADSLRQHIMEREMQRRQMVEEAQAAEEMKLRQAADARAAAQAVDAAKAAEPQRQAAAATLARGERADAMVDVEQAGVGGELTGDAAARARRMVPAMVNVDPGQLASRSLDMTTMPLPVEGAPEAPVVKGVESAGKPEKTTSKGTRRQQLMQRLQETPDMSDRDIMLALLDASGDDNIPASAAEMLSTDPKDVRVFRRTTKGDLEENIEEKGWTPHKGALPEKERYQIINEPTAGGGANASPFVIQIPGARGTELRQGRTGAPVLDNEGNPVVIPLRDTGAQAQARVDNAAAKSQAEILMEEFKGNPDWVGPLAGRFESMQSAYLGNDKEFARFEARTNSLKNRFIKAITGAQMSEAEATRIMKQLPDVNLPPVTFQARLEVMLEELNVVRELQQQVFSGQRAPSPNPVTESRLQELFPDSKVSKAGGEKTTTGSSRGTGAGTAAGPKPAEAQWETVGGVRMRKVTR